MLVRVSVYIVYHCSLRLLRPLGVRVLPLSIRKASLALRGNVFLVGKSSRGISIMSVVEWPGRCVEVSRDCGISIGVLPIIGGLLVFGEAFTKSTFRFSYVLLITFFFALNHINQVAGGIGDVLFNLFHFLSAAECICGFSIFDVGAGEATTFRVTAKNSRRRLW